MTRKQIEQELAKVKQNIVSIRQSIEDRTKRLNRCYDMAQAFEASLREMDEPSVEIKISDHAIIRYLERVKGWNIDSLREEILPKRLWRVASGMGLRSLAVKDAEGRHTHTVKLRGDMVTTVYGVENRGA